MKKYLLIFLIIPFLLISCDDDPLTTSRILNEEFPIKVKSSVLIDNKLEIYFEDYGDSRCPVDDVCTWVGNAWIKLRITENGSTTYGIVTIDGNVTRINYNFHKSTFAFEYKITFMELNPYPDSRVRIDPNSYTAILSVSKIN